MSYGKLVELRGSKWGISTNGQIAHSCGVNLPQRMAIARLDY